MEYEGQKESVLSHLKTFGSITSWDAIQKYRITRLSEYIRSLRSDGKNITSVWEENGRKRYVRYKLENSNQLAFV